MKRKSGLKKSIVASLFTLAFAVPCLTSCGGDNNNTSVITSSSSSSSSSSSKETVQNGTQKFYAKSNDTLSYCEITTDKEGNVTRVVESSYENNVAKVKDVEDVEGYEIKDGKLVKDDKTYEETDKEFSTLLKDLNGNTTQTFVGEISLSDDDSDSALGFKTLVHITTTCDSENKIIGAVYSMLIYSEYSKVGIIYENFPFSEEDCEELGSSINGNVLTCTLQSKEYKLERTDKTFVEIVDEMSLTPKYYKNTTQSFYTVILDEESKTNVLYYEVTFDTAGKISKVYLSSVTINSDSTTSAVKNKEEQTNISSYRVYGKVLYVPVDVSSSDSTSALFGVGCPCVPTDATSIDECVKQYLEKK